MKKGIGALTISLLIVIYSIGCRNNPSTSAFPSVGQMLLAPFHHQKEIPESFWFSGIPDDKWTPLAKQMYKRDGTNFLGVYQGMIAEFDFEGKPVPWPGLHGVMMFSDTSGECLKWISYQDFQDIFVYKTKPEYK